MSKLARKPIEFSQDIQYKFQDNLLSITGKSGTLSLTIPAGIKVSIDGKSRKISVNRESDEKKFKALQGTVWSLIKNMIVGLTEGFTKELEIIGVGYNVKVEGKTLLMNVGYNHPIKIQIPDGIEVKCPTNTLIQMKGIDKQKLGQFSTNVKNVRPINVYTLKGIRYKGEIIKQKPGKSIVGGTGAAGGAKK